MFIVVIAIYLKYVSATHVQEVKQESMTSSPILLNQWFGFRLSFCAGTLQKKLAWKILGTLVLSWIVTTKSIQHKNQTSLTILSSTLKSLPFVVLVIFTQSSSSLTYLSRHKSRLLAEFAFSFPHPHKSRSLGSHVVCFTTASVYDPGPCLQSANPFQFPFFLPGPMHPL